MKPFHRYWPTRIASVRRSANPACTSARPSEAKAKRWPSLGSGVAGEIEWFDAVAVTGHHHSGIARIDEHEREHPAEPGENLDPPEVISVEDHLGVAFGHELRSGGLQLRAQLLEVVDLPVEYERRPRGRADHRLRRDVSQVDDRQAPVAQNGAERLSDLPAPRSGIVGTAMPQPFAHCLAGFDIARA